MKLRRISCVLLILCLICSVFSPCVSAAEETVEIVHSGKCGALGKNNEVTWTLDSAGVLTISGTGEMRDWFPGWRKYKDDITSVVVEEGVTNIGAAAFRNCHSLVAVQLPEGITDIGVRAFGVCKNLNTINIPSTVKNIDERAFFCCEVLPEIGIPNSVTHIGDYAFAVCSSLSKISIPNSVRSIGEGTFSMCSNLNSVGIPNSVTSIGASAFQGCGKLRYITIPESVNKIDVAAFENTGLQHIAFAGAAPNMDEEALYNISAKVYYSGKAASWREEARTNYGGSPTWEERLKLEITEQSKTVYTRFKEITKAEVKAKGNGLSYVWYYKDVSAPDFVHAANNVGATYEVEMNNQINGRQVYCEVKDVHGKSVKSEVITLRLGASIVAQPQNVTIKKNQTDRTFVRAVGEELTFTWYVKAPNASRFFEDRTCHTASYFMKMTELKNGTEVYCVITDKYGNTVETEPATFKMK